MVTDLLWEKTSRTGGEAGWRGKKRPDLTS